jgi:phage shock protein PspC (stress-responsive transcriptional regulator)
MKKNISINLSGTLFHIEEDGFDLLKKYLDDISAYFSSYEDSEEIIFDIEGRIAELFQAKLKESKQIITIQDVEEVMSVMGEVKDYKVFDKEEENKQTPPIEEDAPFSGSKSKKLYRDANSQVLGGVASGLGNYFEIDPIWTRLALIALLCTGPVVIIAYLILWIVLPESHEQKNTPPYRKLYRNPDDKFISGVSGGLAAYLHLDVTLLRVLFALSILLGGFGIVAYIILWVITPEAKTVTEKMQMNGEPINLSNIDHNLHKDKKKALTFLTISILAFLSHLGS